MVKINSGVGFGRAYSLPLTDDQFAMIGKIACIFGSIESDIDSLISYLGGIDKQYVLHALVGQRLFGSKIDLLKELALLCAPEPLKTKIDLACDALNKVKTDRNDALHGKWGYLAGELIYVDGAKTFVGSTPVKNYEFDVAAFNDKRPENPLKADKLAQVLSDTEDAADRIMDAMDAKDKWKRPRPLVQLFTAHEHFLKRAKARKRSHAANSALVS